MMMLGFIYMKGNSAREAQVWEMLRRLEVRPSKYHPLFGCPRRLIMEDFVQLRYLNYQLVSHTIHRHVNSLGVPEATWKPAR